MFWLRYVFLNLLSKFVSLSETYADLRMFIILLSLKKLENLYYSLVTDNVYNHENSASMQDYAFVANVPYCAQHKWPDVHDTSLAILV